MTPDFNYTPPKLSEKYKNFRQPQISVKTQPTISFPKLPNLSFPELPKLSFPEQPKVRTWDSKKHEWVYSPNSK